MADVNWVQSQSGSAIIVIDNDSDSTTQSFTLEHDGGGAGNTLFKVEENGRVTIFGVVEAGDTVRINNSNASTNIVQFESSGTSRARISPSGKGTFDGGINIGVESADPDGSKPGVKGDLALWDDSGVWKLCVCDASPNSWTAFAL